MTDSLLPIDTPRLSLVALTPELLMLMSGDAVGFHCPPRPLAIALDDPTFVGEREPGIDGVVEIGYTIFPDQRGRGYATEAVTALVDWAAQSSEVRVVLAAIVRGNDASVRVLERVGGFVELGTCRNDDGEVEVVYRRDVHAPTGAR